MNRFFLFSSLVGWSLTNPATAAAAAAAAAGHSPFLKEILQGRCYFAPPITDQNDVDVCPYVVNGFMNALESNLDADIEVSTFEIYLNQADFSSPPNRALFVMHFLGDNQDDSSWQAFTPPPGFVTPEDTPGGALLKDLVFCGVDQRNNCSIEKSNGYWVFWEAAYAAFASQAQGHVQIVVEPLADIQFLQRSAVPNLQADKISSVTIYGNVASSEAIASLMNSLSDVGIKTIIFKDDIIDFYLDNRNSEAPSHKEQNVNKGQSGKYALPDEEEPSSDTGSQGEEQHGGNSEENLVPTKKKGVFGKIIRTFITMVLLVGAVVGLYYLVDDGHFRQFAGEYVARQFETIRGYFTRKTGGNEDEANSSTSESSPLINGGGHHDFFLASDSPPNKVVVQ